MKLPMRAGVNMNAPTHADATTAAARKTESAVYVRAYERRADAVIARRRDAPASRVQPARDLAQTHRRPRPEVHHLDLIDPIDLLRLARRRQRHARHLGELLRAAQAIEADVRRDD